MNLIDPMATNQAPAAAVPAPAPAPAEPAPMNLPPGIAGGKVCPKCQKPMREDSMLCLLCGHRLEESTQAKFERRAILEHEQNLNEVNELGRKSLLSSLILFFIPVLPQAVGAYLGFQSIRRSKEYEIPVSGMAVAGLCISGVFFMGWALWGMLIIFSIHAGQKASEKWGENIGNHMPVPKYSLSKVCIGNRMVLPIDPMAAR